MEKLKSYKVFEDTGVQNEFYKMIKPKFIKKNKQKFGFLIQKLDAMENRENSYFQYDKKI